MTKKVSSAYQLFGGQPEPAIAGKEDAKVLTAAVVPTGSSGKPKGTGSKGGTGMGGPGSDLGSRSASSADVRDELGVSYFDPSEGMAAEYVFDPELAKKYPDDEGEPYEQPLYPGASATRVVYGGGFTPGADADVSFTRRSNPYLMSQPDGDPTHWANKANVFAQDVDTRRAEYEKSVAELARAEEIGKKIRTTQDRVSPEDIQLYANIDALKDQVSSSKRRLEQLAPAEHSPGSDYVGQSVAPRSQKFKQLLEGEESSLSSGGDTRTREDIIFDVTNEIRKMNDQYARLQSDIDANKQSMKRLNAEKLRYAQEFGESHSLFDAQGQRRITTNISRQIDFLRQQNANILQKMGENRKDREYLTYTLRRSYGYFQ